MGDWAAFATLFKVTDNANCIANLLTLKKREYSRTRVNRLWNSSWFSCSNDSSVQSLEILIEFFLLRISHSGFWHH